jgi:hypothetical protein
VKSVAGDDRVAPVEVIVDAARDHINVRPRIGCDRGDELNASGFG